MKVATLTMQRTLNYGAQIQTFALRETIMGLGHECKVLNYMCPAVESRESPFGKRRITGFHTLVKCCNEGIYGRRKFEQFEHFASSKCGIEGGFVDCDTLGDACKKLDAVVVGSDQIWNTDITGGDLGYFLEGVDEGPLKVSYAASLGTGKLDPRYSGKCLDLLRRFDAISVRETASATHLAESGLGRECSVVLDPTLLVNPETLDDLSVHPKFDKGYVLLYMVGEKQRSREVARRLARERRVPLVAVDLFSVSPVAGAKNLYTASPEEFLGLIKGADAVVTSSFHGFCLSVAFERDFYYVLKDGNPVNSRIVDLAERLGLLERDGARLLESVSDADVDWAPVRERLGAERKASLEFLRCALGEEVGRVR